MRLSDTDRDDIHQKAHLHQLLPFHVPAYYITNRQLPPALSPSDRNIHPGFY